MMKLKSIGFAFFILLAHFAAAQGKVDGFFKGKSNLDLVVGGGLEVNNKFYAGEKLIDLSRNIVSSSVFAAYGISDRLDLNVSLPFISTEGNSGLQDGSAFLKFQLFERDFASGKLSITMAAGLSRNLTDYETEGIGAIGQQATVYDLRPVLHYFASSGWFATLQYGYQDKSGPTPDANNSTIKIGKAASRFYADAWYEVQESDGGLDYKGTPKPETFKQLGVDYHKAGVTFYQSLKENLGYYIGSSYTLKGRNTGSGPGFFVGMVFKP